MSGMPSLNDHRDPESGAAEVPVILDVAGLVRWSGDRRTPLTIEDYETASARVGRNASPWLTYALWSFRLLPDDVVSYAVPSS